MKILIERERGEKDRKEEREGCERECVKQRVRREE